MINRRVNIKLRIDREFGNFRLALLGEKHAMWDQRFSAGKYGKFNYNLIIIEFMSLKVALMHLVALF